MPQPVALACSLLVLAAAPVGAADSPGTRLDLTAWKLTLPIDTERPSRPDEVKQPELARFVHPDYFFMAADGRGVVCRAPCGGITTKGSSFPRCELREMTPDGKRSAAWCTDDGGTHTLTATLAVTRLPAVKPHVVCAQIHDAEDDLLMIRLERTKLMIERNDDPEVVLDREYRLGTPFDLQIQARDGRVSVSYNGARRLDWQVVREGCYFKAGCYTQSNVERGDAPDAAGEVVVSRLHVEHLRPGQEP